MYPLSDSSVNGMYLFSYIKAPKRCNALLFGVSLNIDIPQGERSHNSCPVIASIGMKINSARQGSRARQALHYSLGLILAWLGLTMLKRSLALYGSKWFEINETCRLVHAL